MANICIKSFQVMGNDHAFAEFSYNDSARDGVYYDTGIDGRRMYAFQCPTSIGNKGGGGHFFINSQQAYVGVRIQATNTNGRTFHIGLDNVMRFASDCYTGWLLDVYYGDDGVHLPDGTVLEVNDSFYLELGYDGTYLEVRIDTEVAYRAEADIDVVKFFRFYGYTSGNGRFYFQDFYINNGEGNVNNSFWGNIKVDAVPANALINQTGWTDSDDSTDNLVPYVGIPANQDTHIHAKEAGSSILYGFDDLASDRDPLSVSVTAGLKKPEIGAFSLNPVCKVGDGSASKESLVPPVGYYNTQSMIFNKDPNGAEWTLSAFNQIQAGFSIGATPTSENPD